MLSKSRTSTQPHKPKGDMNIRMSHSEINASNEDTWESESWYQGESSWQEADYYNQDYDHWDQEHDFSAAAAPLRGGGGTHSGGKGRTKADAKHNSRASVYSSKHIRRHQEVLAAAAPKKAKGPRSHR